MKKTHIGILVGLILLLVNPLTLSWANEKIKIEKAKKIVSEYIQSGLEDENWKENSPSIADNGTFYYTDDTNTSSYIEFQITCEREIYCWFVIVNIDGNDAGVPISSTIGSWPAKVLTREWEENHTKMYYFGPIVQYSKNEKTGEVFSIDPQDYHTERKDAPENQKYLQEKFQEDLQAAIDFKNSSEFQEQVEELRRERQSIPKDEFARSMKVLDMSYADLPIENDNGYVKPTPTNKHITWISNPGCGSTIPCYHQHYEYYESGKNCASGCGPVAVAMVFAYYDRNGYPNLIPNMQAPANWQTSSWNNSTIEPIVNAVRWYMGTYCQKKKPNDVPDADYKYSWATPANQIKNAIKYAKLPGKYPNSTSQYSYYKTKAQVYDKLKEEVNANRPIVLNTPNHVFVWYGYYTGNSPKIIRVNMGWWEQKYIKDTNEELHSTAHINYNIDSIYYNKENKWGVNYYTTFQIQQ